MTEHAFTRRIVHLGGYDPMAPPVYHRRFLREMARFNSTWTVRTAATPLDEQEGQARWQVSAEGPGWSGTTQHIILRWDDVIETDRARGWGARLGLGLLSGLDFTAHGALWGYLRHAWRYAGFFLYPFVLLAVLAGIAIFVGRVGAGFIMEWGGSVPFAPAGKPGAGLALWLTLSALAVALLLR
jgi:hypothetical protein